MTKGEKRMTILGAIILFCVVGAAGIISSHYMGSDNPVEETAEAMLEEEVEDELHLPDGSMKGKIDLTPNSKENNK